VHGLKQDYRKGCGDAILFLTWNSAVCEFDMEGKLLKGGQFYVL